MSAFRLELYVIGRSAKSQDAEANVRRLCEERLAGRYQLDVTDVLENPEAAESANIVATPTLVRWAPLPVRVIVGDLSLVRALERGLGLDIEEGNEEESGADG